MPDLPNRPRYAARLNAFKLGLPGKPTVADLLDRAGQVAGLDAADLTYPDHFEHHAPAQLSALLAATGMALNGPAMRTARPLDPPRQHSRIEWRQGQGRARRGNPKPKLTPSQIGPHGQ